MMTLSPAISRVASRLNKNSNDTTVFARIKNHLNDTGLEKWNGYAWSFRYRSYPIVLIPRVTSGTVSVTNGQQTVTASGTPFDISNHVGAWIRFTADTIQAWYRVIAVASTSSLTIEPAYQGSSGALKAYELCVTDYLLPTELIDLASIKVTYDQRQIVPTYREFTEWDHPPLSTGSPLDISILRQSQTKTTYNTGTLSGTINTVTLTGVGTAWLQNIKPGDEIVIGTTDTNTYRVYSVDSDTQITLYNHLVSAASGSTYTATRQFGKILRVRSPDNPYVIFVIGLRDYPPLVNNIDSNEILNRYPQAMIEGAVWREAGSSPDPREDSLFQRSEFMWIKAQGEDEALLPRENRNPIWDPRQCR